MQGRVAKESGSEMVELFPEMKNSTITESCTKTKGAIGCVCVDLVERSEGKTAVLRWMNVNVEFAITQWIENICKIHLLR